jgi:hypothetical protein
MVVKDPKDGTSPIASTLLGGRCVFVVAVAGNSYNDRMLSYARNPATARLVSVAHEFAHCLHHAALRRGEPNQPPPQSPQAEAMADTFAVLWVYCMRNDRFSDALTFLRAIRGVPSALYALSGEAINKAAAEARSGNACSAGRPGLKGVEA